MNIGRVLGELFDNNEQALENWNLHILNLIEENDPEYAKEIDNTIGIEKIKDMLSKEKLSYSNHSTIEEVVKNLIQSAGSKLKEEVAKNWVMINEMNDRVNACAHEVEDVDQTPFISLSAGLSYQIYFVSHLFASIKLFIVVSEYHFKNKNFKDGLERKIKELIEYNIDVLKDVDNFDLYHEREERLPLELQNYYYELVKWYNAGGCAFVISHEMAHHKLLHTLKRYFLKMNNNKTFRMLKSKRNIECRCNFLHKNEFDADENALKFMFNDLNRTNTPCDQFLCWANGPLLALIASATVDEQPHICSDDHPAISVRYTRITEKMKRYLCENEINKLEQISEVVNMYINMKLKLWEVDKWWKSIED